MIRFVSIFFVSNARILKTLHHLANFGPRNVPKALKNVEIMGILQARKWYVLLCPFPEGFHAEESLSKGKLARWMIFVTFSGLEGMKLSSKSQDT